MFEKIWVGPQTPVIPDSLEISDSEDGNGHDSTSYFAGNHMEHPKSVVASKSHAPYTVTIVNLSPQGISTRTTPLQDAQFNTLVHIDPYDELKEAKDNSDTQPTSRYVSSPH
jgi:hypothetical protein